MSKSTLALIITLLLAILVFRFYLFFRDNPPYHDGQKISLATTLQEEPVIGSSGQKFTIKTQTNQLISVTADTNPQFHYGQVITVSGQLQQYTFQDGQNLLRLYHPTIVLEKEADNSIAAVANTVKSRTEILYNDVLSQTQADLLMGMVFGANEMFPANFHQALQTTGVLHVIAASGMNVTFVSAALLYTLGFFFQRRMALIIGALGIIFYVFLVGFNHQLCAQVSWDFWRLEQVFSAGSISDFLQFSSVGICYCCGSRIFFLMLVFNFLFWQPWALCFSNR